MSASSNPVTTCDAIETLKDQPLTYFYLPDIGWDAKPRERKNLPKNVILMMTKEYADERTQAEDDEYIGNALSNYYGFCVDSLEALDFDPVKSLEEAHLKARNKMIAAPVLIITPNGEVHGGSRCNYYLKCDNIATLAVEHPILGKVPTCQRCKERTDNLSK